MQQQHLASFVENLSWGTYCFKYRNLGIPLIFVKGNIKKAIQIKAVWVMKPNNSKLLFIQEPGPYSTQLALSISSFGSEKEVHP